MRQRWPWPVHPILFAVYFVLFLYAQNLGEVEPPEVLPVLLIAIVGSAVALLATAIVWRDLRRGAIVVSALVVVVFGYGHVANALADVPAFLQHALLQQVGWAVFLLGSVVVAWRIKDRLPGLTTALDVVAGILVVVTLFSIVPHLVTQASAADTAASPLPIVAGAAPTGPKRDVWYLIFDRYGADDQLSAAYGIDDDLFEWLESKGFYVARDSHANYVKTSLSLASSLNLTYLDDLAKRMGPDSDDHGPVFAMLQDHVLGRFLQSQGYRFVQVGSAYSPTNVNPYADENPRLNSTSDFAGAIYDTSVIPSLARRLGLVKAVPSRERYYDTALFQWSTLDRLVDDQGPKLVFAHFLLPHPPYVFNADGSFHPEEDASNEVAKNYGRQLAYTNTMIKALMTKILALPDDRRPIIVLQADEGPYPNRYARDTINFDWATSTQAELHMKYGILNAYDLPGIDTSDLYQSITPVNSFRYILGKYFGADTPLLPDREYTSRGKFRPYDMTDVTDRLAAP